jgi:hypothetical protein
MHKYVVGYIVGASSAATVALALDHAAVDWTDTHKNKSFEAAVLKVIESNCEVDDDDIDCD